MRDVYGRDTKRMRSATYEGSSSKGGILDVNLRNLGFNGFEDEIRGGSLRGVSGDY